MTKKNPDVIVKFPVKMHDATKPEVSPLFSPARYKIFYGGRAAGKSHGVANALIAMGTQKPLRILCAREFQASILQSCWQLLCDTIERQQLQSFYDIEQKAIRGKNGTQITFQGIRQNIASIKSFEGTDICWVEEAANVSDYSWSVLIPTIRRKAGSEVWVTFNPEFEHDSTFQRFVVHPPAGSTVVKLDYFDNPFLEPDLMLEIEELKLSSFESYLHVYEGQCRKYLDGAIYKSELREADENDRITSVPYVPQCGVETFWDIGIGDATSIWVAQRVGQEYHLIDYIEENGKSLSYFLMILNDHKRFPFPIDRIWLPHDATAREKGSGLSYEEQVRNKGYRVSIVPKLKINDGINAVRTILPLCYFDKLKCSEGLTALRNYTYDTKGERNPDGSFRDGQTFHNEPKHDKWSHAADALRYMAIALKPPKPPRAPPSNAGAWARFNTEACTAWMDI